MLELDRLAASVGLCFTLAAAAACGGAAATGDDASWPTDAACADGGLGGEAGQPFLCGSTTCYAGSEYCGIIAGGRILPQSGCHPLPCACTPTVSCACVQPLLPPCTCSDDGGALTLTCAFP